MGYAIMTDKPFVTTKKIPKTRKLTPEMKARREFIRSHRFSVTIDPVTQKPELKVTEL